MKIIKKAYKFRIYPTLEQVIFFLKNFGCVRKVHNLMLDDRKKGYEEYKSTGIKTRYPTPAKYKEEYPYLKEVAFDLFALKEQRTCPFYQQRLSSQLYHHGA